MKKQKKSFVFLISLCTLFSLNQDILSSKAPANYSEINQINQTFDEKVDFGWK